MFTLGCDPELVCRRNGSFVSASRFFKMHSSFGLDGCESIAEIRPGYSESPVDLTSKIYQIIEYGVEKTHNELEFFSGHYVDDYAIGGHIHFSIEPDAKIIEGLDVVLGSFSNCIDDKEQKLKRERTGYGKRGAYRRKYYGFEYRTPGSFLLSPSVTLIELTLAKLTILGIKEDNLDFVLLKERQKSATFLRNLKNYLITIPDDCREGLKELDLILGKKINWNANIVPLWGLGGVQ